MDYRNTFYDEDPEALSLLIHSTDEPYTLYQASDSKYITAIRNGFIRKVYGIVLAQIALTTAVAGLFTSNHAARIWILSNSWVSTVTALGAFSMLMVLTCAPNLKESHPTNLYMLFGFTTLMSVSIASLCAVVAAAQGISAVLQALLGTTLMVGGLTGYAMQTQRNFTNKTGILTLLALGLLGFGLLRVLFPYSGIVETIYALAGAAIFSAYLVVDTQLLIGKDVLKVSEDDYVMIAIALYLDIINIFVSILQFFCGDD